MHVKCGVKLYSTIFPGEVEFKTTPTASAPCSIYQFINNFCCNYVKIYQYLSMIPIPFIDLRKNCLFMISENNSINVNFKLTLILLFSEIINKQFFLKSMKGIGIIERY